MKGPPNFGRQLSMLASGIPDKGWVSVTYTDTAYSASWQDVRSRDMRNSLAMSALALSIAE